MIIAGGYNAATNYVDFWNDATFLYSTLIDHYGYTDSTIYFLYADGNTPSASNCNMSSEANPFSGAIDYSNTKSNLQTVFSSLASILTSYDQLLILVTSHGSESAGHPLVLWGATISDTEFASATYLGAITSYYTEIIVMQNCYSGVFIDNLHADTRVVITACNSTSTALLYWGPIYYGVFDYYWISAIHGSTPGGTSVDADSNDDGKVSIYEAFVYAYDHDPYNPASETPQYDDPGDIGDDTYLN
jgi:hypothetical protein